MSDDPTATTQSSMGDQEENYITTYDPTDSLQHSFNVIKPKFLTRIKYLLIIFFGGLFLIILPGVGLLVLGSFLINIFVTPRVYYKIANNFVQNNISVTLKTYTDQKRSLKEKKETVITENINSILGLKFDLKKTYFLEADAPDLDLNDLKNIFSKRVFDIISASLSVSFIILIGITSVADISKDSIGTVMFILIAVVFFSPLLVCWLVPIIWTLEDSAIKVVDNDHNIKNIASHLRQGIFKKVMGTSGLIMAYGFLLDHALLITNNEAGNELIQKYAIATGLLVLFILLIAAPSILLVLIYARKYHAEVVNLCRNNLKEIIPTGVSQVKNV